MAAIQSGCARTVALCLNAGMNGQDEDYAGFTCADVVRQSCDEAKADQMLEILDTFKARDLANPPKDLELVRAKQREEPFASLARQAQATR